MDKQMYNYIAKDAIDDIQDVADGINELNRIWQGKDPQLVQFLQQLNVMRQHIQQIANMPPQEPYHWNPAIRQIRH